VPNFETHVIVGHVGSVGDLKYTSDGVAVINISVAGMTYDEAVYFLLMSFLRPEDDGSVARAGLRVRESREKKI
jgi:hypothetical protein